MPRNVLSFPGINQMTEDKISIYGRQEFLKLPVCDQLRAISTTAETLSSQQMSDAIKLLAKIVLDKNV